MLTQEQIDIIIDTMKPFNPTKIGVFGSMARGDATVSSDMDILYSFQETIGLFKLIGLQQKLEEKLHKKVDLVAEKYINPKLRPRILNELRHIYGS